MNNYRYKLEKGSRKFICPECGKKAFVRYQNIESSEYIPGGYGRCDREVNCGYNKNPYTDRYGPGFGNVTVPNRPVLQEKKHVTTLEMTSIPINVLSSTLSGYNQNGFIINLLSSVPYPFDTGDIEQVIKMYYLGTVQSGYMKGAITLPFIDISGRVMAIQAKQFDGQNHSFRTSFLHALIEQQAHREGKPLPCSSKINRLDLACSVQSQLNAT